MNLITITGTLGLLLLLTAFVLNLAGKLGAETTGYLLLNIIGCAFLTWYAIALDSVPFMILEAVWGLSSLIKLGLIMRKRES